MKFIASYLGDSLPDEKKRNRNTSVVLIIFFYFTVQYVNHAFVYTSTKQILVLGIREGNKASQIHLFNTNKYMYVQFTKETSNPLIKSLTMSTAFFAILFDLKKVHCTAVLKLFKSQNPILSLIKHASRNTQCSKGDNMYNKWLTL